MKRFTYIIIIILFIFPFTFNQLIAEQNNYFTERKLRILILEGSHYEIGLTHGKKLKNEIHSLVRAWKDDVEKTYKVDADTFIVRFLNHTNFLSSIKKWTPGLIEELKGIAKGAEIEFNTMLAYQLVDEMWVMGKNVKLQKCTSIGVNKNQNEPSLIAQNLDIPLFYHGYQTLLHIKNSENGIDTYVFTFPGYIGANGINNKSIGVVVNAIQDLKHTRDGLPVAFTVRGILQKKSFKDVLRFINNIKHAAPQNYIIGGDSKVASFECSENVITEFLPFKGANFTYHTNLSLSNYNINQSFLDYLKTINMSHKNYAYSCSRLAYLTNSLKDNKTVVNLNKIKTILSSRNSGINRESTYGCTIMVLSENPELHISAGRPDEVDFQIYKFIKK